MRQFAITIERQKLWVAILAGAVVGYLTVWGIGLAAGAAALLVLAFVLGRLVAPSTKPDWASDRRPSS